MSEVEPFDPSIPQEEVDRLFRKLRDTRIPREIVPGAEDNYGTILRVLFLGWHAG